MPRSLDLSYIDHVQMPSSSLPTCFAPSIYSGPLGFPIPGEAPVRASRIAIDRSLSI
jgi:hypothetical protein